MAEIREAFTTGDVSNLTGVHYVQLHRWVEAGTVTSSIRKGGGLPRSDRLWSFADVVEARTVAELRRQRISFQAVRKVVAYLREHTDRVQNPLATAMLVVAGKDVLLVDDGDLVSVLRNPGQGVIRIVHLGNTVLELKRQAAEILKKRAEATDGRVMGVLNRGKMAV